MNIDQKGTQVNHTTRSARIPSLRTGLQALRGGFGGGGGSGAGFLGGRTSSLRLVGLLTLASAALLAVTAGSASALTVRPYESQITRNLSANGTAFANPFGLAVDNSALVFA
jgi:hypothetical protein